MSKLVGIQFQKLEAIKYYKAPEFDLQPGDLCIVRTLRGKEIGRVVALSSHEFNAQLDEDLYGEIIKKADEEDIKKEEQNRVLEKEAFQIGLREIKRFNLPMKLVKVRYLFDHSKIIFYFTAENKVDFRKLVRKLASIFKTRIEMKQIGVRDCVRMLGALGPCGLTTCCSTFLRTLSSVTIKMAKEQSLVLNPAKVSGICGRLMCCLQYEYGFYKEIKEKVPALNTPVKIGEQTGKIVEINYISERIVIKFEDNSKMIISFDDIGKYTWQEQRGEK